MNTMAIESTMAKLRAEQQLEKIRKMKELKDNEHKYIEVNPQTLFEKVQEIISLKKSDNPPPKEKLEEMLNEVFQNSKN